MTTAADLVDRRGQADIKAAEDLKQAARQGFSRMTLLDHVTGVRVAATRAAEVLRPHDVNPKVVQRRGETPTTWRWLLDRVDQGSMRANPNRHHEENGKSN